MSENSEKLYEIIENYVALRNRIDLAEASLKVLKDQEEVSREIIITFLKDMNMTMVKTAQGDKISLMKPRLYASVLADRRGDFEEWLDENGLRERLSQINSSALTSHIKSMMDEGETCPDFIDIFLKSSLRLDRNKNNAAGNANSIKGEEYV